MNKLIFVEELKKIGINITSLELKMFDLYFNTLIDENTRMNLTSITNEEEVYYKHFYDSLVLSQFIEFDSQSMCDVGSGAGFPSIPLKIIYPNLNITIVDSLNKRIGFLEILCQKLEIDVNLVHNRAEDFSKESRESFDIVTARAVASLQVLNELCIPLVKVNGIFIAPKGQTASIELEKALNGIKKLGCVVKEVYEYDLPFEYGNRNCILIKKIKSTPSKYPRNYGQIKNNPI